MNPADDELPPEGATEYLAEGAQGGDRNQFDRLYERVAPAVFGWARLRVPPGLRAVVGPEDIVQEVWFRAIGSFQQFDAKQGPFRRWVFGIARNVLLKALRGSGGKAGSGYKDGAFDLEAIPEEATAVSLRASRQEGVGQLVAACEELGAPDRELLLLRGLEGLSHDEVARQLGVDAAAVRKRWQRLKKQLGGLGALGDLIEA